MCPGPDNVNRPDVSRARSVKSPMSLWPNASGARCVEGQIFPGSDVRDQGSMCPRPDVTREQCVRGPMYPRPMGPGNIVCRVRRVQGPVDSGPDGSRAQCVQGPMGRGPGGFRV